MQRKSLVFGKGNALAEGKVRGAPETLELRSISTHRNGSSAVALPPCSDRRAPAWAATSRRTTSWPASRCTSPIICFTATAAKDDKANSNGGRQYSRTKSKRHCCLRICHYALRIGPSSISDSIKKFIESQRTKLKRI